MEKRLHVFLLAIMMAVGCFGQKPTVYYTKEISAESLVKIYEALGVSAEGKRVAVKISTGETAKTYYLRPELIKNLVQKLNATLVECNTAYGGNRTQTAAHRKAIAERGFDKIAKVDIMDEDDEIQLPVKDTKHIKYDIVGSHVQNYDLMVNLAHFKGHGMGGFGGVLKNQSIGMASTKGKFYIHSAGRLTNGFIPDEVYNEEDQYGFLESMAAAAQAVHDYYKQDGRNIVYINVMNNMSIGCDCQEVSETPELKDMGIMASLDPVALDYACLDMVYNHQSVAGDDAGPLIKRIEEKHGTHTVSYAAQLGLGSMQYTLKEISSASGINGVQMSLRDLYNVYTLDGKKVLSNAPSLEGLKKGVYIVNGEKRVVE